MDTATLLALLLTCAPQIDARTALALIEVESSGKPQRPSAWWAARCIASHAPSQRPWPPQRALHRDRWNFSLGLAQINVRNLGHLRLTLETVLDPCANLGAMQILLADCYQRAAQNQAALPPPHPQRALRQALSCYYSGNFVTGFEHGYVHRVAQVAARIGRTYSTSQEMS